MIEKGRIEELKKQLKEEVMTEIKAEIAKNKQIKILDKEDLMNMFKMGRTKLKKFIDNKQSLIKVIGEE